MLFWLACTPGELRFEDSEVPAVDTAPPVVDEDPDPLVLAWPLAAGGHVTTAFVDLDDSEGAVDYAGGDRTRDGLARTEISIASFTAMDAGVDVLAAASGVVIEVEEAQDDRNVACESEAENLVRVLHPDGSVALYGNLKRDSVQVARGSTVDVGEVVARVGSSGCSSWPHLGFELRGEDESVIDPFSAGLWVDPPLYDPPFEVLEFLVAETHGQGDAVTPSVVLAGVDLGQRLDLQVLDTAGILYRQDPILVEESAALLVLAWESRVGFEPGTWSFEIYADDVVVEADTTLVEATLSSPYEGVWIGVPMNGVHWLLADQAAQGCHATAFDGYQVLGEVYFNLLCDSAGGTLYANLSLVELEAQMDGLGDAGQHPTWLDSWPDEDGETRYAVLVKASAGLEYGWYAAEDEDGHEDERDRLVGEGLKPVAIERSGAEVVEIAALYDSYEVGEWHVVADLSRVELAETDNEMRLNGLALVALDGYALAGDTAFVGIWHEVQGPAPFATWGIERDALAELMQELSESGYTPVSVVGFADGGEERFAAIWTK